MKTDIFEDMKERVGCDNISDLPYRKRAVWEEIKRLSPTAYPKEQLEKFSHYVFGVDYAVIMGILEMKKGSETPVGNEMKAIQQKWFSSLMNLSTIRTRYVTMMWVTVRILQNTLSVRKMFSVRFLTNCKST